MIAAGVRKEGFAEEKRRAEAFRRIEQGARANLARRRRPQVESAAAAARRCRLERPVLRDRLVGDRAPLEQLLAQLLDVRVVAALEIIGDRGLHVEARRHVVRLFAQQQPFENRARRGQPADAQARRDRLRERRDVDDVIGRERDQRRARAVASGPYGSSSTIGTPARRAMRRQSFAPIGVHRGVRRIVQRRHRVDEARAPRAQDRLDVVDAHALVVDRHRDRAQAR